MNSEWHLKKEITLSVIFLVVGQFVGSLIWINNLSNTVKTLETNHANVKDLPMAVALMVQDVGYIRADIKEIKATLEKE